MVILTVLTGVVLGERTSALSMLKADSEAPCSGCQTPKVILPFERRIPEWSCDASVSSCAVLYSVSL